MTLDEVIAGPMPPEQLMRWHRTPPWWRWTIELGAAVRGGVNGSACRAHDNLRRMKRMRVVTVLSNAFARASLSAMEQAEVLALLFAITAYHSRLTRQSTMAMAAQSLDLVAYIEGLR